MTTELTKPNITADDLVLAFARQGIDHTFKSSTKERRPLAQGNLSFCKLSPGLSLHVSDCIEKQTAKSRALLGPSLNLNLLIHGEVCFTLAKHTYTITANNGHPVFFATLLRNKEVFSRHLKQGQQVKKISISASYSWLQERCDNDFELQALNDFFMCNAQVVSLNYTAQLAQLFNVLITNAEANGLERKLMREQTTLNVLSLCLNQLKEQPKSIVRQSVNIEKCDELPSQIVQAFNQIQPNDSLSQIATRAGMSVSSLQRKVKKAMNTTAIEYLRIKRLESAKSALVIDNISLGEAAYLAGYNHAANFVTAFKKQFGITPKQFCQQHQISPHKSSQARR